MSIIETINAFLSSSSEDEESSPATSKTAQAILESYQKEKRIAATDDTLQWWKDNQDKHKVLARIARTYLACPSGTIPSEQLFSGAGTLYDERRSRLKADNAAKNVFKIHTTNNQIQY